MVAPATGLPDRVVVLISSVAVGSVTTSILVTGLTKGNLSVHLSKLEEAGYVAIEKTFRGKYPLTMCRLTEQGRAVLESYRKTMRSVLGKAGNRE